MASFGKRDNPQLIFLRQAKEYNAHAGQIQCLLLTTGDWQLANKPSVFWCTFALDYTVAGLNAAGSVVAERLKPLYTFGTEKKQTHRCTNN